VDIFQVFAKNLKECRKKETLFSRELAEKSGLHRTYISDIECCRRSVSLGNIQKIADALK